MIVAIHGFLGLPSDWSLIPFETDIIPVNLWNDFRELNLKDGDDAFGSWAERFLDSIRAMKTKPTLLGYSLGGRLALHVLFRRPALFAAGIIVSAHPGLTSDQARRERFRNDEMWSRRFAQDSWETVLRDWNAQKSLQAPPADGAPESIPLRRDEHDFDRGLLSRAMRSWSLARQADLRSAIHECPVPLTFVNGGLDTKFRELVAQLAMTRSQSHIVIPNAGHRVPWDQPSAFVASLRTAVPA